MGTDIHLFVEKKINGRWEALKGPNPDIHYYKSLAKYEREKGNLEKADKYLQTAESIASGRGETADWGGRPSAEVYKDWIWSGRNYHLFGILCGVRRDNIKPIDEPRGLPNDISEYLSDYDLSGRHSASYLTVRDIVEYDWNQELEFSAWVNPEQFKEWMLTGKPRYSSDKPYMDTVHLSNEEMRRWVKDYESSTHTNKTYSTEVFWTEPYYESAYNFYRDTIPDLEFLADGDLDSVRIVFWFS